MNRSVRTSTLGLIVFAACLCVSTPAAAYIDPNVGSQIVQFLYPIIALFLGFITFCRQWIAAVINRIWTKMRNLVSRGPN